MRAPTLLLALLGSAAGFLPLIPNSKPKPNPSLGLRLGLGSGSRVFSSSVNEDVERRKNPEVYEDASGPDAAKRSLAALKRPQVLAPAGGWDQLRAAVANGCDAVYFGLQPNDAAGTGLNARARADNFRDDELSDIVAYLHEHGVRGYLTLNVLIFEKELAQAQRAVRNAAEAGVDALIIQDIGLARLAHEVAPHMPIHASTQMSVTSAQGVKFAAEQLGVSRVVLARELSVGEIQKVASAAPDIEVEVFVHGALCVSYSGQCFSSEAWGGRSANRGQCAQGCRMPYGMLVDGELRHLLEDASYLLSPQDLMALDLVPELMEAGVACLKIEGRLKGAGYVALATQAYRAAVDATWADVQRRRLEAGLTPQDVAAAGGTLDFFEEAFEMGQEQQIAEAAAEAAVPVLRESLRQVFARAQDETHDGLTLGYLNGTAHQEVVRGRSPRHRGLCLGRVTRVSTKGDNAKPKSKPKSRGNPKGGRGKVPYTKARPKSSEVVVELELTGDTEVKAGDGVVFEHTLGPDSGLEQGGVVFQVDGAQGKTKATLVFRAGSVDPKELRVGGLVWRTRQVDLDKKLPGIIRGDVQLANPNPKANAGANPSGGGVVLKNSAKAFPSNAVKLTLSGAAGEPLKLRLVDMRGRTAEAATASALEPAAGAGAVTLEAITKAVGEQLGGNVLRLGSVDARDLHLGSDGAGLFLPLSEVKAARRTAAEMLLSNRQVTHVGDELQDVNASDDSEDDGGAYAKSTPVHWSVLCRTPEQVSAAVAIDWLPEVVLDFLEIHGLKEAVAEVRASGKRVAVATPRVLKPGEDRLWRFYLGLSADALLVRSAGMLQQLQDLGGAGAIFQSTGSANAVTIPELYGDFSLNAANARAADLLLNPNPNPNPNKPNPNPDGGTLARLTPTHDLSADQICALAEDIGGEAAAERLEVIVHQHLPVFHTEHCVFCRFLSDGNSYKDCGHPCESHTMHLRDQAGADHLVLADMGCRNTVFNAKAQSALPVLEDLLSAGLRRMRIELVDEPAAAVPVLLEAYRGAAEAILSFESDAEIAVSDAWAVLETLPDANGRAQGLDLGSLASRTEVKRKDMKRTAYQEKRRKSN
eukprot:CAMPEP_0118883032 /NCGR_PEP_ID=MMETSP1163-20130328/22176_1 /TAXON_ID=124430 /ORGANISM="Phaeomonas parva, Strain CCMP2877" /LENGTH=1096 /DNA_ID=CAMNT_0006820315 /DNA_START=59 /DNA_END=3349 /DNA_ORIENTATION=+